MDNRVNEIKYANELQNILGEGYKVNYDECESCMTRVYYKNILVKEVKNCEMKSGMNISDFVVDYIWKLEHGLSLND